MTADKCEVWVATQNGEASLAAAAEAAGLPPAKCEVYKPTWAAASAGAAFQDYVTKAVLHRQADPGRAGQADLEPRGGHAPGPLPARRHVQALGRPGREGRSRRPRHAHLGASRSWPSAAPSRLDNGKDSIAFQGLNAQGPRGRSSATPSPTCSIEHAMRNTHVPPGFWRGVNNNQNAIWLECFMDELAQGGRQGPAGVPAQADGQPSQAPGRAQCRGRQDRLGQAAAAAGVIRGIAQMMGYGSYVAGAAEVSVSDRGKVKVDRLVLATDSGHVVNPDQVDGPGRGLGRLWPRRHALPGVHASRTAASWRRTSTPIR